MRAVCGCACGGLGMLLLAGASIPEPDPSATNPGIESPAIRSPAVEGPAKMGPAEKGPAESKPGDTKPGETKPGEIPAAESSDDCLADPNCITVYLWSLYERTPKIDTVNVPERTTVTVKVKGKTRTIARTVSRLADEDFAWKDPKAAELAGMSLLDYVIGGMDPGFRAALYRALRALDEAGFKPGIMCAFRDDYRQSIATGLKAQNDRSYHGGSFRGGYGHGMAADIVSVRGATRAERLASSTQMWDYIDAHEKDLGIGRPYRDRDPPHIGPIDGEEYADHRFKPKMQHAEAHKEAESGKRPNKGRNSKRQLVTHDDHAAIRHTKVTNHSKAQAKARIPAI